MKLLTRTHHTSDREGAIVRPPAHICMHILKSARDEVRTMRAATTLAKHGYAISIIDVETNPTLPSEEMIEGVKLEHMVIPDWFISRRFQPWFFLVAVRTFFLGMWRLFQSRADVYHALELTSLPTSYIVSKLRRKPLIFEAFELHLPIPETDVAFWRLLGPLFLRTLAFILPRCAGVITVSSPIAKEISARYSVPEVTIIRNVPQYMAVQKSDRLRRHLKIAPQVRIALYQGGLQKNRGLDMLVRAARFLGPDIVIVMMGQWLGNTQEQIERLIDSEGVADRVKIVPQVPYTELLSWTSSADIGLTLFSPDYSSSIRWCLPNKLFEYLMAGLPVLSSQLDAVAEIIATYDVGCIVETLSPDAIGEAINTMLADRKALERMSRNTHVAAKECCWENDSQELLRLYQKVVDRR